MAQCRIYSFRLVSAGYFGGLRVRGLLRFLIASYWLEITGMANRPTRARACVIIYLPGGISLGAAGGLFLGVCLGVGDGGLPVVDPG